MYRKILIIFVSVFIVKDGIITQALLMFMILVGILVIHLKKKPFSNDIINNVEVLSVIASTVTIFCGLFFILDIS